MFRSLVRDCDWRGANVSQTNGGLFQMYFAHRSSHKVYTMSHFRYENLRVCKKKESSENAMPKIIMMMVFFLLRWNKSKLGRGSLPICCTVMFAVCHFYAHIFASDWFHFSSSVSVFLAFGLVCCHCRRHHHCQRLRRGRRWITHLVLQQLIFRCHAISIRIVWTLFQYQTDDDTHFSRQMHSFSLFFPFSTRNLCSFFENQNHRISSAQQNALSSTKLCLDRCSTYTDINAVI